MRLASLSPAQRKLLDRLRTDRGAAAGGITAKAGDRTELPLSFAQQRIWFFDRLQPDSTLYNIAGTARLVGPFDVDVVRRSLDEVVRRHEVLRTTYHLVNGRPVQRVNPPSLVRMPVVDLRGLPEDERQAAVLERYRAEVSSPFDLERDLLLRPVLLRVADEEHLIVLSQHHIATDGWSLGLLLRELSVLYSAFARSQAPALPPLQVQYGDFAVWQRDYLSGPVLAEQLGYWGRQLAGAPLLDLPTARPRPPTRSWDGDCVPAEIPPALVRRLTALAESERGTLFMVLYAALSVVLSRWSGQPDVVVGAPIANRNRAEVDELIGCFVNTLPLRLAVSGQVPFRRLLRQARQVALDGYAHQDVPFEKIIEEINPERDAGAATPLVRHMLGLHNTPKPQFSVPGLSIDISGLSTGKARFDLELELSPDDAGGITGVTWFAADLFTRDAVTRLMDSLRAVLEAVAADPDQPVWRLPLLAPRELAQLLDETSGGARVTAVGSTITELVESSVDRAPGELAVVSGDERVSYAELDQRANQLAWYLRGRAAVSGQPVGICLVSSVGSVVAAFAVLKAGGGVLILDPDESAERCGAVLQDAQPALLITDRADLTSGHVVGIPTISPTVEAAQILGQPTERPKPTNATALAELRYPPGAEARGVALSHEALVARTRWMCRDFDLHAGQFAVSGLPADVSWPWWWALASGATLELQPIGSASEPHPLRRLFRTESVHTAVLTPAALAALVSDNENADETRWPSNLLVVGEQPWPALVRGVHRTLPNTRLFWLHGHPETGDGVTAQESAAEPPAGEPWRLPAGRPAPGTWLRVLDEFGQPTPVGVTGRLYVGGVHLARGYWRRPGATATAFVPDPFRPGERLFRTAELARWLADGRLDVIGSAADRTWLRRRPVDPGEVESVLATHPEVERAVVRAVPSQDPAKNGSPELLAHLAIARTDQRGQPAEQRRRWRERFHQAYLDRPAQDDPALNATGWTSQRTGDYLPAEQVRDWSDGVLRRILEFEPDSVVEVGCRTGLLLFRLAPRCQSYWGIDPSANALGRIREHDEWLASKAESVRLLQLCPDELDGLAPASADLLVLNGVVQYFPSLGYLELVLSAAARVVRPGGSIVLTEVGDLQRYRAGHGFDADREEELLLDPEVFPVLANQVLGFGGAQVLHRTSRFSNELTSMRYDVVLQVGPSSEGATGPALSLAGLATDPERAAHTAVALPRIRAHLRERLPEHLVPTHLIPVSGWPLRGDGLLDPAALPLPGATGADAAAVAAPRTPTERAIAAIWAEVLGLEHVGVHDDFFALGGHSLMGAEIVDRVREVYDVDLPLGRLFESPTVAAVSGFIDEAVVAPPPSAAPIRRIDRDSLRRTRPSKARSQPAAPDQPEGQ